MSRAFSIRGAELHHRLNLDDSGIQSQKVMESILQHAAANRLNQFIIGESWPLGLSRLISCKAIPELAAKNDAAAVNARRRNFERLSNTAGELGLTLWGNLNLINVPAGFSDTFPEAVGCAIEGIERSTRSLLNPPLCPRSEPVQKLLQIQAGEILDLPGIKGLSLWLNMSDTLIFSCSCECCRELNLSEKIAEVTNLINKECLARNKQLNVRTYLGSWQCGLETDAFLEAAPLMDAEILITYKQQQGDMYNEHPINPLLGQLAPHKEMIEFDGYGEYRGESIGIVCSCRKQIQERMKKAMEYGVIGTFVRGMHHIHPFSIDADAFAAFAADVDLDNDAWCHQWLKKRFGAGEKEILTILDSAWEVCKRSMYIEGINWASWSVPQTLDRIAFILYDRSASCIPGAFRKLKINDAMISRVAVSHDEAIKIAKENLETCQSLKGIVADDAYEALLASMQVLYAYAKLVRHLIQSVLLAWQWQRLESPTMREFKRFEILKAVDIAKEQIVESRKLMLEVDLRSLNPLMGPVELNSLPNSERILQPCKNAEVICNEIMLLVDVKPTSFTGIAPWPNAWPKKASISDFGVDNS